MDETDEYKGLQVILPRGEGCHISTASHRMQDVYGHPIGGSNSNPLLDTHTYKAEYVYGDTV